MPTIGLDCQIILDGTGYFVDPETYVMVRARVRAAQLTKQPASGSAGAGERYLDQGPAKRQWTLVIQAYQTIRDYAGNLPALTGQQYRDALHASYQKINTTLLFTDPQGTTWSVHFDHLEEQIVFVRAQTDGELQYHLHIVLIEA